MPKVTDAVILMAGAGSRLRSSETQLPKPLMPVASRPLISHVIDSLARAGVEKLYAVVGSESDQLLAGVAPLIPGNIRFEPIFNTNWRQQNGVSLLCAEGRVKEPFFLTMADHVFEQSLLDRLVRYSDTAKVNVAIDRKVATIFDLEDAMKVETKEKRLVAIGKNLVTYDAIDTGVFLCPHEIFAYLHRAKRVSGDCSLADGIRLMAEDDKAAVIDIGDSWWQDVDTPAMLAEAEGRLLRSSGSLLS